MVTLIIILTFIAIYHLIYQSFVLPTLRLEIRFRMFKLRDDLRRLKLQFGEKINDDIMIHLQRTINNNIRNLPWIDFAAIHESHKFLEDNPKVRNQIEEKRKIFEDCEIEEVRKIYSDNVELALFATGANSGGWLIYIVPILIVIILFGSIKNGVKDLLFISDRDMDNIISDKDIALT